MVRVYREDYKQERKNLLEKIIAHMTQGLINGFKIDWPEAEYKKIFVDDVLEHIEAAKKVNDQWKTTKLK